MKFPYLPIFFHQTPDAGAGAPAPTTPPVPTPAPAPTPTPAPAPTPAPTTAPEPLPTAPPVISPLAPFAAAAGMSVEDFTAALATLKVPAPTPTPAAPPAPEPAPADDSNLTDLEKAQKAANDEKTRADANETRIQRYEILESCDIEAVALNLAFQPGTLSTLHAAGAFKDVTFDANGKPQNVRKVLESIALANPWALKVPGAVDTGARAHGTQNHIISDEEVAEAARKYGVRR